MGEAEKLFYDLFSDGRWIGMASGADEDEAKRMAARSLPELVGRFTLVRWYGRLDARNCQSSGGAITDPQPEPKTAMERASRAVENLRRHRRQLDEDGVEIAVSRQALDEVLKAIGS